MFWKIEHTKTPSCAANSVFRVLHTLLKGFAKLLFAFNFQYLCHLNFQKALQKPQEIEYKRSKLVRKLYINTYIFNTSPLKVCLKLCEEKTHRK